MSENNRNLVSNVKTDILVNECLQDGLEAVIPAYARIITRGVVTDLRTDISSLELFAVSFSYLTFFCQCEKWFTVKPTVLVSQHDCCYIRGWTNTHACMYTHAYVQRMHRFKCTKKWTCETFTVRH